MILPAAYGVLTLLSTAPLAAKESKGSKRAICTAAQSAYRNALDQEQAGHLREARGSYQTCSEASVCSFAPKCKARYEKLTSEMPTVVPVVIDGNGSPRLDVDVTVDGQPLTSRLDGRGLPVDVGLHEFTFASKRGVFASQKVLVIEGQHDQEILVTVGGARARSAVASTAVVGPPEPIAASEGKAPAADPPAPGKDASETVAAGASAAPAAAGPEPTTAHPGKRGLLPYIIGGVGVLGLGAGAALTYWGKKDNDALGQCAPQCLRSSVDHIRTLYTIADISFGVGVAGLLTATYLFSRPVESPRPQSAYVIDVVVPTRSGAFASVSGKF